MEFRSDRKMRPENRDVASKFDHEDHLDDSNEGNDSSEDHPTAKKGFNADVAALQPDQGVKPLSGLA